MAARFIQPVYVVFHIFISNIVTNKHIWELTLIEFLLDKISIDHNLQIVAEEMEKTCKNDKIFFNTAYTYCIKITNQSAMP